MVKIVVLVIFVMVMFLWLLMLLGAIPNSASYSPWLAWFACLSLGVLVLAGTGWVSWQRPP